MKIRLCRNISWDSNKSMYKKELADFLNTAQNELIRILMFCYDRVKYADLHLSKDFNSSPAYIIDGVPLLTKKKLKPSSEFIYHYLFGEVEDSFIHNFNSYIEDLEDIEEEYLYGE